MSSSAEPRAAGLAVVSQHVTPYRLHLHRRIAREIPELRFHGLFVGVRGELTWSEESPAGDENTVVFAEEPERDWSVRSTPRAWRRARRILAHCREHDVRALIVNGYSRPTLAWLLLLAPRAGIATFLRGDSNAAADRPRTALHRLAKRAFVRLVSSRCAGVLCMGALGRAYYESYGVPPDRCFEVPYEPDLERFRTVPRTDAEAFAASVGLAPGRRRLLFVGRIAAVKRVDLLLTAFARVAEERPGWDVVVVGAGPVEADARRAVPDRLAGRVHWLGFREVDDLRLAYHACDALVVPSDVEPWGVVVQEAVAAGLAVVASDVVGAARELVEDGVSGAFFRAGDASDLERVLRDVMQPGRCETLRSAAPRALAAWRERADPVRGLRRALAAVKVLP